MTLTGMNINNNAYNSHYVPKKKKSMNGIFILAAVVVFALVFTFLSLNLKNIELGYEMQELLQQEKTLVEEIDKLKAQKAELLNLERVEDIVMTKLGYRYPQQDQFIKVFEREVSNGN